MAKAKKAKASVRTKRSTSRATTPGINLLITGFGPFPGAPDNPTGPLVRALTRQLRANGSKAQIHTHIFRTTYAAVDRDLPRLIARKKPHAVLMFGLATRSRGLRVETQARNRIGRYPDAAGIIPATRKIVEHAPRTMPIRAPKISLLRAARSGSLPARLSVSAGDYLCNYLYWHALEAVRRPSGPTRAVFIHVPPVVEKTETRSTRTMKNLVVAAEGIADVLIKAARPRR